MAEDSGLTTGSAPERGLYSAAADALLLFLGELYNIAAAGCHCKVHLSTLSQMADPAFAVRKEKKKETMLYTPLTKKALALCFEVHKEQKDKAGLPYVFHPFHVAEQMTDEYAIAAALLHDVAEDSAYSVEELSAMGFPKEVCDALRLLTHDDPVPYLDYIRRLKSDPVARTVKMADLLHNSDLSRLDTVDEEALARAEKYKKALELLEE